MKKYLNYHGLGVRNATVIYVKVAENVFAVSVSKWAKNEMKNKVNRKNIAAGRKFFSLRRTCFVRYFRIRYDDIVTRSVKTR